MGAGTSDLILSWEWNLSGKTVRHSNVSDFGSQRMEGMLIISLAILVRSCNGGRKRPYVWQRDAKRWPGPVQKATHGGWEQDRITEDVQIRVLLGWGSPQVPRQGGGFLKADHVTTGRQSQAGDLNSLCVCWRSHWAKIASPIKIFHIPSEQFQPSERRNCPSSCNFNQQERTGFYTEIIGTWGESDHVFWESIIARQGSVTQMRRQCNNDELWCRGKGYANSEASVATHNFLMNSCSQKGVVHKR